MRKDGVFENNIVLKPELIVRKSSCREGQVEAVAEEVS
jgi:hypothetical protein